MTSVKCFGSWLKEAGRGHLTALFGWTTFFIYTVLLVMRLILIFLYVFRDWKYSSALAEYGTGRPVFFLEFFYLLQQRRNRIFLLQSSGERKPSLWSKYSMG